MRPSIALLIGFTVYAVSALPVENDFTEERPYSRYVEIAGGDGQMHQVDLESEPDYALLNQVTRNPANTRYLLMTRINPTVGQTMVTNDANSIIYSHFNPFMPTVVVIHGWLGNQHTDINPIITNAILNRSGSNVIVVDWSSLASSDYVTAVRGVPAIGLGLARFLSFLSRVSGAPLTSMHLVGFSLGAHVAGNAGRELGGRVARVTGLDPAGPLWNQNIDRLSPIDAIYVEAIHTDGGITGLGIGSDVGHVDFYPNGGNSQPGCIGSVCSHNRAWEFFASSVTRNHLVGRQCSRGIEVTMNRCRGVELHMGNDFLTKTGSGVFRVNTERRYPF